LRKVLASEVRSEVGGGKQKLTIDESHG
jgi:hypothetical protein